MDILIIHDPLSANPTKDELDTLNQVEAITEALHTVGHNTERVAFTLNLEHMKELLEKKKPDYVINLVETLAGSRLLHLAPALCETMGIPFSGGSSYGLMISGDKLQTKKLLLHTGIPTPLWIEEHHRGSWSPFLHVPIIIKPIYEEASVGITDDSVVTIHSEKVLRDTISHRSLFAELYIQGREFNVSILPINGEPYVLPIAEMLFIDYPEGKPTIVGYDAKWEENSFAYTHTQRTYSFPSSDDNLLETLKEISVACWNVCGAKGYARIDFRVNERGEVFVLEVNMNPCLSKDSGFVASAQNAGFSYCELISLLITGEEYDRI